MTIDREIDPAVLTRIHLDARQRRGKMLVVAGWVLTVAGAVIYCLACFGAGADQDLGQILAYGSVPFARGALGVVGLGTLLWLVGSFTYLRAAMDAFEPGPTDDPAVDGSQPRTRGAGTNR
ncbi:MAG: hypothetical protein IT379_42360 [Deltaproteobacteria bacterium]|nr:hypothetical protein [Deltaproteobacteria bacterium]